MLTEGLTLTGQARMLEAGADEAEQKALFWRARAVAMSIGRDLLSTGWQRSSAVLLTLLAGWLGFGGD